MPDQGALLRGGNVGTNASSGRRYAACHLRYGALLFFVVGLSSAGASPVTSAPATTGEARDAVPVGDWLGTLNLGAVKLRLVFHLARAADGTMSGTLDSIDQGAKGIPLSRVTTSGQTVRLESLLNRSIQPAL